MNYLQSIFSIFVFNIFLSRLFIDMVRKQKYIKGIQLYSEKIPFCLVPFLLFPTFQPLWEATIIDILNISLCNQEHNRTFYFLKFSVELVLF